jgi:hypothetical protein
VWFEFHDEFTAAIQRESNMSVGCAWKSPADPRHESEMAGPLLDLNN